MTDQSLPEVASYLNKHQRFFIMAHYRPDGDAYGSTLGLAEALRAAGKDVIAANQDGLLPNFRFLPGSETLIAAPDHPPEADRQFIAVDTSDPVRLGAKYESWGRTPDLNIDHHVSNHRFAARNLVVPDVPATAQILLALIEEAHLPLPPSAASNLFVGLTTDTGSFRHRSTSAESFRSAARLIEAGADPTDLALKCYSSYRMSRLLLLREVLNDATFLDDGSIAYFHLLPEMYERTEAVPSDGENFLDYLQMVETVQVAFVLEPMEGGIVRASLRSRGKANVQEIASQFGGGGHTLAAGLRSRKTPAELESEIITAIREQLAG